MTMWWAVLCPCWPGMALGATREPEKEKEQEQERDPDPASMAMAMASVEPWWDVLHLRLPGVRLEHLLRCGLEHAEAQLVLKALQRVLERAGPAEPPVLWRGISRFLLRPSHPFALHRLLYSCSFRDWNSAEQGPPPAWVPSLASAEGTNVGRILKLEGRELLGSRYKDVVSGFVELQKLSVEDPEAYWSIVLEELDVPFVDQPSCIVDTTTSPEGTWLPGATLNAASWCLQPNSRKDGLDVAVLWRDEGEDDSLESLTLDQLRARVCQVANALQIYGFKKGDAIAIDMPMTVHSVVIYLAIVLAGCVVVSIADSFAPTEIATRLEISKAKGIFTQDFIVRGKKALPLYFRVVEANAPAAIVIEEKSHSLPVSMRKGDISWEHFLTLADSLTRPFEFEAVVQPVQAFSNILFSSGTTGDPKAIPWTHLTPIKAAADAWAHHDLRRRDVVAWPTNLGWMMGPWLVYAALLNGSTIALYNGFPSGRGFAKFVQDARVTMLGVVPSIVKAWKSTDCVAGLDWSSIRCFSSTGEASNVNDYLWLMGRSNYKPVIEYCGGTEIGGAFVTGSLLQPQALAAFSTPAMGCAITLLDDRGVPLALDKPGIGECALNPVMLGASSTLLNADHFRVYFKDMPVYNGTILRRHGDEFERTAGGFYRAHGRVDDTMNLGGIKVSSVEIERLCNSSHESVLETAAIGVPQAGGGPEELWIVTVLKGNSANISVSTLKQSFTQAIQARLNPLFKVSQVVVVPSLPRTASNKVMRRTLRSEYASRSSNAGSGRGLQTKSSL